MGHRKEKHRDEAAHVSGAARAGGRGKKKQAQLVEAPRQGYYGSGGSYGYGGGFEHPDYREGSALERGRHGRADEEPGWYRGLGPMEPFAAYGGFGSSQGDHARPPRSLAPRGPFYGRAPKGYTRSDERIREDICDQLMLGHVDPTAVSVSVTGGEVTLEGQVGSRRAKYVVEEIAAAVLGVKDVENRLRLPRTEEVEVREQAPEEPENREPKDRSDRDRN
jgi:hypothetical protein